MSLRDACLERPAGEGCAVRGVPYSASDCKVTPVIPHGSVSSEEGWGGGGRCVCARGV